MGELFFFFSFLFFSFWCLVVLDVLGDLSVLNTECSEHFERGGRHDD